MSGLVPISELKNAGSSINQVYILYFSSIIELQKCMSFNSKNSFPQLDMMFTPMVYDFMFVMAFV